MCLYLPKDYQNRETLMEGHGRAMASVMEAAFDKWTDEDWEELDRLIAEDEGNGG